MCLRFYASVLLEYKRVCADYAGAKLGHPDRAIEVLPRSSPTRTPSRYHGMWFTQ